MTLRTALSVPVLLAALTGSAHAAPACSRADIDHFLARGFTPEQVVRLCGSAPAPLVAPQPTAPTPPATGTSAPPAAATTTPGATTAAPAGSPAEASDAAVLRTALDADDVQVTPSEIRYTWDRCLPYGEEGYGGLRPRACVTLITHIDRHGLQVRKAVKGIFLLREPVLRIAAPVRREVRGLDRLKPRQRAAFLRAYPEHAGQIDLPLKHDMNPQQIAGVLRRLALP